jgi:methyl-accepting chemotaxis protein
MSDVMQDAIYLALGAHGMWKDRLKKAIAAGASEFAVERVEKDNLCDFGRWLYSVPAPDRDGMWERVRGLHADFHRTAAATLGDALSGRKEAAQASLALGGDFAKSSRQLQSALLEWHKILG